jgi:8-oxo-dGTP pyrophosphatase MutT (NUDIX family)
MSFVMSFPDAGIPAGSFEPGKHESIMQAAADELNEEAGLQAARLIPLTMAGIPADKYSANRLYCFIALDCTILQDKRPLDDTEDIGEALSPKP